MTVQLDPQQAAGTGWRQRLARVTQRTGNQAWRFAVVIVVSVLGGWLAHLAHVPLAWLLGALAASCITSLLGVRANFDGIRPYVLIFLGLGLGQTFSQSVLLSLLTSLPAIILCAMLTMATGLLAARVFTRYAGMDARTAFFCGTPGGVVLMAIHAREAGLNEQQVVLAQTIRLMLVVLIYPALVAWMAAHGEVADIVAPEVVSLASPSPSQLLLWWMAGLGAAFLGKKIGIPNPWMLAPCVLAALFSASGTVPEHVPSTMIIAAQLVLGITMGSKMTREFVSSSRNLIKASVLSSLLLSVLLVALALLAAWLFGLPRAASLLGMAPGGMPEMAVTAHALHVSVPMVLGFHFVRVVFSNLLIEPIWRGARVLKLI